VFISALHFLFLYTLAQILMRTLTMHVVSNRPGSSLAQAMSYVYG
jgi:hypothetical protein